MKHTIQVPEHLFEKAEALVPSHPARDSGTDRFVRPRKASAASVLLDACMIGLYILDNETVRAVMFPFKADVVLPARRK